MLEHVNNDDHAFATPYHSHVGTVHATEEVTTEPVDSTALSGEVQPDAISEGNWTTDEEAIDTPGMTRTPNSPVQRQGPQPRKVPSEPARLAAEAVMRTDFPTMLAEMNPDWAPLTAQDLLHNSDNSSDSVELLPSEEEPDEEEYYTDSEEGFPNIQRVSTYPARLTEDGGVERIGPVEVISEADPSWHQLDQDHWVAHRSDSDYKVRARARTAASISFSICANKG